MFRRRYLPFLSLSLLFCLACNKTNDATITTAIQAKMFADPLLKSASIAISTKDGVVTLSGQVPSDAARAAALQMYFGVQRPLCEGSVRLDMPRRTISSS